MSALFVLVFVSIGIAGLFLLAFIWNVKDNQYEDKKGAALRILHDNELLQDSNINKS
jgi:cbb3-type cytochrome oxidase maturation protein